MPVTGPRGVRRVPRATAGSLLDRHQNLLAARSATEEEMARLAREEEFLAEQVREAAQQVRYYEGLLANLRRDWHGPGTLAELVRRLG